MELDKEVAAPAKDELSDALYCNKDTAKSPWHDHIRREEDPEEADSSTI